MHGIDEAIWRRIRLVPFTVVIPPEDRDQHLIDKLKSELDGILAWMLRGCEEWRGLGVAAPSEVTDATETYRQSEDRLSGFIAEECLLDDLQQETRFAELYRRYREWAVRAGEHGEAMSSKAFSGALDGLKIEAKHLADKNKTRVRVGIRLRPEGDRS